LRTFQSHAQASTLGCRRCYEFLEERNVPRINQHFQYDVAISFAGAQRSEAQAIAKSLSGDGLKVFYEAYEQAGIWGKNLYDHLADIYQEKARY
jgi:hypothetical protein